MQVNNSNDKEYLLQGAVRFNPAPGTEEDVILLGTMKHPTAMPAVLKADHGKRIGEIRDIRVVGTKIHGYADLNLGGTPPPDNYQVSGKVIELQGMPAMEIDIKGKTAPKRKRLRKRIYTTNFNHGIATEPRITGSSEGGDL